MSENILVALSEYEARSLRASTIVSSLHSAFEEVILNSIDAHCTSIDATIDFCSNSFTVVDNGEWNHTSKPNNKYGMKGEALAAICQLAKRVEIRSQPEHSQTAHIKQITEDCGLKGVSYETIPRGSFNGTSIQVHSLLHGYPVRRKAAKECLVVRLIEDFVRKMSVLHYGIKWIVTDVSPDRIERVICSYVSHESMAEKFASIHGRASLNNMEDVTNTCGPFVLRGLLTPPRLYLCYTTKRGQYAYLNQRWLKCNCFVASIVNDLYDKFLAPNREKRVDDTQQRFPNFVLQIECPEEEYEILSEPDKTLAFFRHESQLIECVSGIVRKMFEKHLPQHVQQLNYLIEFNLRKQNGSRNGMEPHRPWAVNGESYYDDTHHHHEGGGSSSDDSFVRDVRSHSSAARWMDPHYLSWRSQAHSHNVTGTKRSSDSVSSSNCSNTQTVEKKKRQQRQSSEESPHSLMFNSAFDDSTPVTGGLGFSVRGSNRGRRAPQQEETKEECTESSEEEELTSLFGVNVTRRPTTFQGQSSYQQEDSDELVPLDVPEVVQPLRFTRPVDTTAASCVVDAAYDYDDSFFKPTVTSKRMRSLGKVTSKSMEGHVTHTLHRQKGREETIYAPRQPGPALREDHRQSLSRKVQQKPQSQPTIACESKPFTMHKTLLPGLRVIGQCDNKFIIAMAGDPTEVSGGTLLAFDQHAVDERINFERLRGELSRKGRTDAGGCDTKRVNELLSVGEVEASVLYQRRSVFQYWGFDFAIGTCSDTTTGTSATTHSCLTSDSTNEVWEDGNGFSISLQQVPVVLGEQLTVADFLEFIRYVEEHMCLSDGQMKQPAVQRILASKACHSSVRFGDSLAHSEMKQMLSSLAQTDTPFNCAHGRPSVVPLNTLRSVGEANHW